MDQPASFSYMAEESKQIGRFLRVRWQHTHEEEYISQERVRIKIFWF